MLQQFLFINAFSSCRRSRLISSCTFVAALFVPSVPASAQTVQWYELVIEKSGSCLDVTGGSMAAGTQLQEWGCWGGQNQQFSLTAVTGGYEITARNSGLSLNVRGSAAADFTPIIQWSFTGKANEIWNMSSADAHGYVTFSPLSDGGACMDIEYGGTTNGTHVGEYPCNGTQGQKWKLVPVATTSAPAAAVTLSPSTLKFTSPAVGMASGVEYATITNGGTANLIFPNTFVVSGAAFAFGGNGTCRTNTPYAPGQSCTVGITFKPTTTGTETSTVAVSDNTAGSAQIINLTGTVTAAPVNGQCGTANGVVAMSAPSCNLCLSGAPSQVSGTGPWTWTCAGKGGGTPASCSAPVSIHAPVTALSLGAFIQSLGVNTHLGENNAYTDVGAVEAALAYTGLGYIRDELAFPNEISAIQTLHEDIGTKLLNTVQLCTCVDFSAEMSNIANNMDLMAEVEGPNEIDNTSGTVDYSGAIAMQKKLYNTIKGNPLTASLPVDNLTIVNTADFANVGNLSPWVDFQSYHIYPWYGEWFAGASPLPTPFIQYMFANFSADAPGKPPVVTEGGWSTLPGGWGVSEDLQAKYTLDFLLDTFRLGVRRTYLYELNDESADPTGANPLLHFGLYHDDWSPKPVASALHNFTTLLADTGTSSEHGSLIYWLDGMPSTAYSLLLQKGDGTFILAVWNEPQLWNYQTLQEISIASAPVLVNFAQSVGSLVIYDPLLGTTPIQSAQNVGGIQLMVPDHPILLFIKPAGPMCSTQ